MLSSKTSILWIILLLVSCTDQKYKNVKMRVDDREFDFEKKYTERFKLSLVYDTVSSQFSMRFTDSKKVFKNEYQFREDGSLKLKTGTNFWGEEEKYFFDFNGSLMEYRKLVRSNNNKSAVQEFILYQNGIINKKQSHYFDYKIIDSSATKFNIEIEYFGGLTLDTLTVFVGDFAVKLDELTFDKRIYFGNQKKSTFWVSKQLVHDSEFDFFQLNVKAHFSANNLDPSSYELNKFWQSFILRKFRFNMW